MARKITLRPLDLVPAIESFTKLAGDRSVMASYKIGKIVEELEALRVTFAERIGPYLNEEGALPADLEGDDVETVEAILNEELEFEAPELSLTELSNLTVSDDAAIFHLTRTGILSV